MGQLWSVLATICRAFVEIAVSPSQSDAVATVEVDERIAEPEEDAEVEGRLRYTKDAAERIYERLLKIVDFRNTVMIALIAVVVALASFLVDKMCDYGWIPTVGCTFVAIVAGIGLFRGRPDDLDIDDFISDMQQDTKRTLIETISDLQKYTVTARRIVREKGRWTAAVVLFIAILSGYTIAIKLNYVPATHAPREACGPGDVRGVLDVSARKKS